MMMIASTKLETKSSYSSDNEFTEYSQPFEMRFWHVIIKYATCGGFYMR